MKPGTAPASGKWVHIPVFASALRARHYFIFWKIQNKLPTREFPFGGSSGSKGICPGRACEQTPGESGRATHGPGAARGGGFGMGGDLSGVSQHPHFIGEETKAEKERLSHACTADYTVASRVVCSAAGRASSSSPRDASLVSCFLLLTLL